MWGYYHQTERKLITMDVTEHKGPLPQVVQDIIDKLRSFSPDGVRTGRSGKHWGSKPPFSRREQRQAGKRLDRQRKHQGGGRDPSPFTGGGPRPETRKEQADCLELKRETEAGWVKRQMRENDMTEREAWQWYKRYRRHDRRAL